MEFGETISPLDSLRQNLRQYPLGPSLLREIVQNSDDAKASKQIFLLDTRYHPASQLLHPNLEDTQGPALLAYNDAIFQPEDWTSIQSMSRSVKRTDKTKIGKYGLGFRSCYHITDTPQILSGSHFAIFDPHQKFIGGDIGLKKDFTTNDTMDDHLAAFGHFLPGEERKAPLDGTIIRLPLRTETGAQVSELVQQAFTINDIEAIFSEFIAKELSIVLLFLSNLTSIELLFRDDKGLKKLASVDVDRKFGAQVDHTIVYSKVKMTVMRVEGTRLTQDIYTWDMFHGSVQEDDAANMLGQRLGRTVKTSSLSEEKMIPKIALAFPTGSSSDKNAGIYRMGLFTFLPLPIPTDLPCHIHALFALTPDRQKLLNPHEARLKGSRDELLIEWNKLIFDDLVPSIWSRVIPSLLESNTNIDPWSLWPTPSTMISDSYWNSLPSSLFLKSLHAGRAVWPLVSLPTEEAVSYTSNPPAFHYFSSLGNAFLAPKDLESTQIFAIVAAGAKVVQPPTHIFEFLLSTQYPVKKTTPSGLREYIEKNMDQVQYLTPHTRYHLMAYLLSTNDLGCIVGIPIIPQVNGEYMALKQVKNDLSRHTMLREDVLHIFQALDPSAVRVSALNEYGPLFERSGPDVLNVSVLDVSIIVRYLECRLQSQEGSTETLALQQWIFKFWNWLAASPLFPNVVSNAKFCGLPTMVLRHDGLAPLHSSIFSTGGAEDLLLDNLERVGLRFIHANFPNRACSLLGPTRLLSPFSISSLLDNIRVREAEELPDSVVHTIRNLFSRYLPAVTLSTIQKQAALKLPIFNVLLPVSNGGDVPSSNSTRGHLSVLHPIRCVPNNVPLPVIPNILFLQVADFDIVRFLASDVKSLSEGDTLRLAIDVLPQQERFRVCALVKYISARQSHIPISVPKRLQNIAFVTTSASSSYATPAALLDPACEAASLYLSTDQCIPNEDARIIDALRSLKLLRTTLTPQMAEERISYVSQQPDSSTRHDLAIKLFHQIQVSSFPISQLRIDTNLEWVPSDDTEVLTSKECYDPATYQVPLFNRVAKVIHPSLSISLPLRRVLGWHVPISIGVVSKQFEAVVKENVDEDTKRSDLLTIIQELGRRVTELNSQDLYRLQSFCSTQPCIPVLPRGLASTKQSFFQTAFSLYSKVPFRVIDPGVGSGKEFLQKLGCQQRPSTDDILSCLEEMALESKASHIDVALELLRYLCQSEISLSALQRARIRVPDEDGILRHANAIYHNDIRSEALSTNALPDSSPDHPDITDTMAKVIGLPFLSSFQLQSLSIDEDEDMGEDLTTRIRGVLLQYNAEQTFTEFLANAEDARAKRFAMLLDERHSFGSDKLLTEAMKLYQNEALVIFNDAVFQDKDFKGIRRVGLGGKRDNVDMIGRFGLGSLSMFHFTEVAMIVSGHYVLFLDPTRQSITRDKRRASLRFTLKNIWRHYPDHLAPLEGNFGFSRDNAEYFDGTLFRLGLRSGGMGLQYMILENAVDPLGIRTMLKDTFLHAAREALLFLRLQKVEAKVNSRYGDEELWTVTSNSSEENSEGGRRVSTMIDEGGSHEQELWYIVTSAFSRDKLPREFRGLIESNRIPSTLRTGIAAHLSTGCPNPARRQQFLYSTLRLPVPISLPVHLNAPFILAPDRRSIRFDGVGQLNLESQFNHWILTHLIPPQYCQLLEAAPSSFDESLWPGYSGVVDENPASLNYIVTDAFFKHLPESKRAMCRTTTDNRLNPCSSRFAGDLPHYISRLLSLLRIEDIVLISDQRLRTRILDSGVRSVGRDDLFPILKASSDKLVELYKGGTLPLTDIWTILQYLTSGNCTGAKVAGIRLLPLGDGSLGTLSLEGAKIFVKSFYPSQFPSARFVAQQMPPALEVNLLRLGLNVARFDGIALQQLTAERLPRAARATLKEETREWVDSLWNLQDVDKDSLIDFPVVPTSKPLSYISVKEALGDTVIFCPKSWDSWLVDCLVDAGAICVTPSHCHRHLQQMISSKKSLFSQVLGMSARGLLRISSLDTQTRQKLSGWLRDQIRTCILANNEQEQARKLPIWMAFSKGGGEQELKALDIYMLPEGLKKEASVHFLIPNTFFVEYSLAINKIIPGNRKINLKTLRQYIRLPDIINEPLIGLLKATLQFLLSGGGENLSVPNSLGSTRPLRSLYSTSIPLFETALRNHPELFLHSGLRDMDLRLREFGLRHELDAENFVQCATAIHEDQHMNDILPRARLAFNIYNATVAVEIRNNMFARMRLNELCFIPRATDRRNGAPWSNQYGTTLPMIVSPKQVLREEFEALAWSQRARCEQAPSRLLLAVDANLGEPTISDVIAHLRVLALQVASAHANDNLLIEDLQKTYNWLASKEHQTESGRIILGQYANEPLFLNVDNVYRDTWQWTSAKQIVFNNGIANEGQLRSAHKFISHLKAWLLLCGALEVKKARSPNVKLSSAMDIFTQQRNVYSRLRKSGALTDVVIVDYSGEEIPGHRLILASSSPVLEAQFTGGFAESASASNGVVRVQTAYSMECLQHCINFIYNGSLSLDTDRDVDTLLEVLALADYWQITELHRKIQVELIDHISLAKYKKIKRWAEKYRAKDLGTACDAFVDTNSDIISQWQSDEEDSDLE
ncbi:hypothetical protein CPB86DRAFT_784385 [Serendipita vermifera]|nr:hypothetical protein CPB86DRAFT_784385 [Serendipita vermifera]